MLVDGSNWKRSEHFVLLSWRTKEVLYDHTSFTARSSQLNKSWIEFLALIRRAVGKDPQGSSGCPAGFSFCILRTRYDVSFIQDKPTKTVKVILTIFGSTIHQQILRQLSDNLAGHFAKICVAV
jgi:hypothetical protein